MVVAMFYKLDVHRISLGDIASEPTSLTTYMARAWTYTEDHAALQGEMKGMLYHLVTGFPLQISNFHDFC